MHVLPEMVSCFVAPCTGRRFWEGRHRQTQCGNGRNMLLTVRISTVCVCLRYCLF